MSGESSGKVCAVSFDQGGIGGKLTPEGIGSTPVLLLSGQSGAAFQDSIKSFASGATDGSPHLAVPNSGKSPSQNSIGGGVHASSGISGLEDSHQGNTSSPSEVVSLTNTMVRSLLSGQSGAASKDSIGGIASGVTDGSPHLAVPNSGKSLDSLQGCPRHLKAGCCHSS